MTVFGNFFLFCQVTKQNAKIWNNIGHAYEATKHWEIALSYFIEVCCRQFSRLSY